MTFQSCPGIVEAAIRFQSVGVGMANVLHFYKVGGSYVQSDLDDLAILIDDWVTTAYLPIIHEGVEYVETHVRGLENAIDVEATCTTGSGPGTASGFALANNVTLCLTLRTGFTGRSARGRIYLMPSVEDSLDNAAQFGTAYASGAVTAVSVLQTTSYTAGWIFCVLSRVSNKVKRATGIYTQILTPEARNLNIDSQRGRLIKG